MKMRYTYTVFGITSLFNLLLFSLNVSADTYIAFSSNRTGNFDIYVMDIYGHNLRNLTNHPAYDGDVTWAPNGESFAFVSNRDGHRDIYIMDVDGTQVRRLTNHPEEATQPNWSPDGHWIVFTSDRESRENYDIYKINVNGRNLRRLTNNRAYDSTPAWSPDGKQIAFYSNRDEGWGIYVMNAEGKHLRHIANPGRGAHSPSWSPDGKRIAYSLGHAGSGIYTMDVRGQDWHRVTPMNIWSRHQRGHPTVIGSPTIWNLKSSGAIRRNWIKTFISSPLTAVDFAKSHHMWRKIGTLRGYQRNFSLYPRVRRSRRHSGVDLSNRKAKRCRLKMLPSRDCIIGEIYEDETHANLCGIRAGVIVRYQSVRQQRTGG